MAAAVIWPGNGSPNQAAELTARQLKQAGHDPNMASNAYSHAWQRQVVDQVKRIRDTTPLRREVVMPSPRDCKATMLHGHAVAQGSYARAANGAQPGGPSSSTPIVCFGPVHAPIPIVPANRGEGGIPSEFWATSSGLDWKDMRGERTRSQGAKARTVSLDAGQRKLHELSSEVFGSTRLVEKSTSAPYREITSKPMLEVTSVDTLMHKATHSRARTPLSARQHKNESLAASTSSQFRSKPQRSASADQDSIRGQAIMFRGKGLLNTPQDRCGNQRRRCERNYSDLFGQESGRPVSVAVAGRSEMHGAATASWMDAVTETSARNISRRHGDDSAGTMIYDPKARSVESALPLSPRANVPERSPEEKKQSEKERACWDVLPQGGLGAGVEIARRRRELRIQAHAKSEGNTRDDEAEPTPSQRKRVNLASGQLRAGTGAQLEPHDDGRGAPARKTSSVQPVPTPRRLGSSGTVDPLSMSTRKIQPPDSARGRKMKEMMTSEGIF
eukprot:TRINITY_DN15011_c0_g1_i2.p1 TRINITY_DN15011_c0_g1~~TRINITY_DN15011_c0_g1_i2.p1  ORF type:complete len:515 (+),score=76.19 TRINITY_DN15011_c0_g1_i2:42-1547(+)